MESDTDQNLTSYLKSMFVQYNGEEHASPPMPAARLSKASLSEEPLEPGTTDLNNNERRASTATAAPPPPPPPVPANGTIEVDVIVHNDATNSVTNGDLNGHKDIDQHDDSLEEQQHSSSSAEHIQPTVDGNKIALSFLDELKLTLQVSKPLEGDQPEEPGQHELQPAGGEQPESLGQQNGRAANEHEPSSTGAQSPPEPATSPSPALHSYASSVQDDEGSANEEVSVESGISVEDDLDDQSSLASESSTVLNGHGPPEPAQQRLALARSASADPNRLPTTGRVVLRSVSQDVKFKLESIIEEKKVTKSHVSELANFWKGRMISPKDKH